MTFPDSRLPRAALTLLAVGIAAATLMPATPAEARPDTRRMSCAQAQELVRRSGSAVITYGPYLYDRFVAGMGQCDYEEETAIRRVPTADNPRCPLRYCRPAVIFTPGFPFDR